MACGCAAVLVRSLAPGRPSPARRKGAPPPGLKKRSSYHKHEPGGPARPPCGGGAPLRGGGRGSVPCASAWAARGAWPAFGAGCAAAPVPQEKRCPPAVRPAAAALGAAALGLCPGVRVCAPVRAHGRPCGFAIARPRLPPLRVRAVVRLAWGALVPSGAKGTGKGPPWMAMPAKETTWPPGSCLRHTRFLRKPK